MRAFIRFATGVLWLVAGVVVILIVVGEGEDRNSPDEVAPPPQTSVATNQPRAPVDKQLAYRLRTNRDEAIVNIGWVAGNAYGHPIWQDLRAHVGRGGDYYDVFMRLAPPGTDHQTEAMLNVALYEEWFERGQAAPYNEAEMLRRTERVLMLVEEGRALLRDMEGG